MGLGAIPVTKAAKPGQAVNPLVSPTLGLATMTVTTCHFLVPRGHGTACLVFAFPPFLCPDNLSRVGLIVWVDHRLVASKYWGSSLRFLLLQLLREYTWWWGETLQTQTTKGLSYVNLHKRLFLNLGSSWISIWKDEYQQCLVYTNFDKRNNNGPQTPSSSTVLDILLSIHDFIGPSQPCSKR